jgi:hypothetical protein
MITSLARVEQTHTEEDTENTNQIPGIAQELQILKKNNTAIINQIEILRQHLEELIVLNNNFTDPEVLATSQALDEVLNKFQRILSSINDNP